MKIGIVHGAGINPDGSLQPHTKARADAAIKVYDNSTISKLIVCGKNEAGPIASYIEKEGVDKEDIIEEPLSYSTLSNLYYCKMLLSLLGHLEPIDRVYPISNYWHIPRLDFDARKILENYPTECIPADDPRNEKEIEKDKRRENLKFVSDRMLLSLGYGKKFDEEQFLGPVVLCMVTIADSRTTVPYYFTEVLEYGIQSASPYYQKKLMKLEGMLYKMMKVV